MNRIRISKFLVFAIISLFIISCFPQTKTTTQADQLDGTWVAHPLYVNNLADPLFFSGYTPIQIRTAYNLPSSGGAGTTIAIVDAFDTPYILSDLIAFSSRYGLPTPTSSNFVVQKMSSSIELNSSWSEETCLDVEWAHAIAPNAKILLVEAISDRIDDLLSAVDNASSYSGVIAVSMSWGSSEFQRETSYDWHFNKPGIAFFAGSGDSGYSLWPASSPNVVAVGGTTLNLNTTDGSVISETAWGGSGGGISAYEAIPVYQTTYGLTYSKRAVPDVSYDANASTGVAVCFNSAWIVVGGTSAGAPQWAAIYALGQSATNTNLYLRAKTEYSSYFRDITSGSNLNYAAGSGYDCVTGLGSPLTCNFGTVTISPTSGPPGGAIVIGGEGFTAGNPINISYLNPINHNWAPIINNWTVSSPDFTYSLNAPDLNQSNTAGDNQPISDNIVFRVQIDSAHSYNSSIPYTEWRRGLTQLSNSTAQGIYGNNTSLASSLFVQSGDALPVCGKNFVPGNVSVLWDGVTELGPVLADDLGGFNSIVQVPATTPGPHQLVLRDSDSDFCFNLTSLPRVADNYTDAWYTSNFTITLTPDYAVNETYYIINGGSTSNVTANGQPAITTEGSANTLEYWSTWNLNASTTLQTPHVTINDIKLDKTPPSGTISTNQTTSSPMITLALSASDAISGVSQMCFSNDGSTWSTWEPYATSETWNVTAGDGAKTISVQYMDNAGLTAAYSTTTTLSTTPPPTTPPPSSPPPSQGNSPTPTATPTDTPTPTSTTSSDIPELNSQIVFILLALLAIPLVFRLRRK